MWNYFLTNENLVFKISRLSVKYDIESLYAYKNRNILILDVQNNYGGLFDLYVHTHAYVHTMEEKQPAATD